MFPFILGEMVLCQISGANDESKRPLVRKFLVVVDIPSER